jgi:hypothetical protein
MQIDFYFIKAAHQIGEVPYRRVYLTVAR